MACLSSAYRVESAVLFGFMLSEAEGWEMWTSPSNCCRRSPSRRNFTSGVTGADMLRARAGKELQIQF